jgi:hypothetical protein
MSFDPHSRRLDPSWLFPAIDTNEEEMSEAPDESPLASNEKSTNDPIGRNFDGALEQTAAERCCVCPLCGAIVASDGTVLS